MLGATREDVDVIAELERFGLAERSGAAPTAMRMRERRPGRRARPGAHRQLVPGAGHPVGRKRAARRARTDVRLRVPVALVRVRRDPRAPVTASTSPSCSTTSTRPASTPSSVSTRRRSSPTTVHRASVRLRRATAPPVGPGTTSIGARRWPSTPPAGGRGRPPCGRCGRCGTPDMTTTRTPWPVGVRPHRRRAGRCSPRAPTCGTRPASTGSASAGIGVTDGPSGARGTQFTGATSTSLPCGTALASTWNRELIGRVGRLLGDEARAKGASVLLAPTVNIHRHPLGGRNFECYSEDPYLTAEIAVAFIEGVQSRGVGCAVKHFVCNDQETDRMEIDVVVDERTRREIYLPPFEAAVRRAGVWAVMAAYNRVDGRYCSEHAGLLTDLLRDEWGFDGVVMSDWFGTHSAAALAAGLDLEMPGPANVLGHHLARRGRGGRRHRRRGRAGRATGARPDRSHRAVSGDSATPATATDGGRRRPRRRDRSDRAARQRRRAPAGRGRRADDRGDRVAGRPARGPGRRQRPGDPALRDHAAAGDHRPRRRGRGHVRGRAGHAPRPRPSAVDCWRRTTARAATVRLDYFAGRRSRRGRRCTARPCARPPRCGSASRPRASRRVTSRPA